MRRKEEVANRKGVEENSRDRGKKREKGQWKRGREYKRKKKNGRGGRREVMEEDRRWIRKEQGRGTRREDK